MIRDIRFTHKKEPRRAGIFYTYDSPGDTAFIGSPEEWAKIGDWFAPEESASTLSHETLHKATWKMDGSEASEGIDKLCESFDYNDNESGLPRYLFHSKRPYGRQSSLRDFASATTAATEPETVPSQEERKP